MYKYIYISFLAILIPIGLLLYFKSDTCDTTLCCKSCPIIQIVRAQDGDTLVSIKGTIRLFGVDTPEIQEPCYHEAKSELSKLAGSAVRIESGPRASDPYGRQLFYVYTINGESIDEILIRQLLGKVWTKDGQHVGILTSIRQKIEAQVLAMDKPSDYWISSREGIKQCDNYSQYTS